MASPPLPIPPPSKAEKRKRAEPSGLKEYLQYSRRAWGLLANISVVTPLVNTFGSLIPALPNTTQVTFIVTIFNILIVYAIWSFRFSIQKAADPRRTGPVGLPPGRTITVQIVRLLSPERTITLTFLALVVLFGIGLVDQTFLVLPTFTVTYIMFFISLTIAFNILATREYMIEKLNLRDTDERQREAKAEKATLYQRRTDSIYDKLNILGSEMKPLTGSIAEIRDPRTGQVYVVTFKDDNSDEIVAIEVIR